MTVTTTIPPHTHHQVQAGAVPTAPRAGLAFAVALAAAFVALNLAVVLLERPLLQILRHHPDATMAQINVLQPGQAPDVLFMGTSRAQFGFDPAAFSEEASRLTGTPVSSLNLGIPGTRLDVARLVLKNRVLNGHKPKLIVYGLSEFELWDPPGVDYIRDVTKLSYVSLAMSPEEVFTYGGSNPMEQLTFVAETTVPLLRYRSVIRDALDLRFNSENYFNGYYVAGPRQRTLREDGLWTFPPDWPQPVQSPERLEAFRTAQTSMLVGLRASDIRTQQLRDFAHLARTNGVALLVLNMPVAESYAGLWQSESNVQDYLRNASELTRQLRIPYLDLYREGGRLPAGTFWDDHHMSNAGAATFSRCIAPAVVSVLASGELPATGVSVSGCR